MTLNITSMYESNNYDLSNYYLTANNKDISTGIHENIHIRINSESVFQSIDITDENYLSIKYPDLQNDL